MVHLAACEPVLGGRVHDREVELRIRGAEVDHEVEYLVDDLVRPGVRAVDLVHDDDRLETELERLAQDETGLRHRPLGRVHHEENRVHHLEDALDLAAEIAVAGRVDDVDLRPVVVDGRVLREDRDPALFLEVVAVHDPFGGGDSLVRTERPGLLEQAVHERRLAVVDVGNDRDVPEGGHGNLLSECGAGRRPLRGADRLPDGERNGAGPHFFFSALTSQGTKSLPGRARSTFIVTSPSGPFWKSIRARVPDS